MDLLVRVRRFEELSIVAAIAIACAPLFDPSSAWSQPAFSVPERQAIYSALSHDACGAEAPNPKLDDAALTTSIQRYAATELGQRISPQDVKRVWSIAPEPRDVRAEFDAARGEGRLLAWIAGLRLTNPQFTALASEACRYRAMVERGGWIATPGGPVMREGDRGPAVLDLRRRLHLEGYVLRAEADLQTFDTDLVAAVRLFQKRHELEEDGRIGPETRAALNVSAEDRFMQIQANLERWRWLPRPMPADRLEVDVGEATATLFTSGLPDLTMRVIVGDRAHQTPMFASRLTAVVFNPPWNVPASIARNELYPREAREPGYLARNGFSRTSQGLQQRPGPTNALGQVKFDLPSPFGVYLHDTPGKASFARRVRTLSHGCIRLEKPRELAQRLLATHGWDGRRIDAVIERGATQRVSLVSTTPLFVVYRTAAVGQDGWTILRRDPYGWDHELNLALAAPPIPQRERNQPETECAVLISESSG